MDQNKAVSRPGKRRAAAAVILAVYLGYLIWALFIAKDLTTGLTTFALISILMWIVLRIFARQHHDSRQ
ncbi:MAG: hypothetical protein HY421_01910 [Candidatus Kerfeldbacteria bacterium]|nr:hypothetical protein [Candidatus Kerfeldbacteria bacterium]